jgi:hypothetical protein
MDKALAVNAHVKAAFLRQLINERLLALSESHEHHKMQSAIATAKKSLDAKSIEGLLNSFDACKNLKKVTPELKTLFADFAATMNLTWELAVNPEHCGYLPLANLWINVGHSIINKVGI